MVVEYNQISKELIILVIIYVKIAIRHVMFSALVMFHPAKAAILSVLCITVHLASLMPHQPIQFFYSVAVQIRCNAPVATTCIAPLSTMDIFLGQKTLLLYVQNVIHMVFIILWIVKFVIRHIIPINLIFI